MKKEHTSSVLYSSDLLRVWIFYDELNPRFTKYSLSSNETKPWKSTSRLGFLGHVDLYNK